ncbi:MAG: hypothetical protein M1812_006954 [Candelaria pacifica]|nr:MAG: hypothetical protein M1812_006954 [Candelaria pacifica]
MLVSERIEIQKEEDQASENSWLSDDASPLQSPSPPPAQRNDEGAKKPKQKRKRRKYHGTASVWTDDEVQKLLRRRWSGETWDATIAAFPHRTRDAVVKRYSTMKCEGKNLTPKKSTSSDDTSEGEELNVEEHTSKKRRVVEAVPPSPRSNRARGGVEEVNGVINVNGAQPLMRSSSQHTTASGHNDVSQTAFEVDQNPSAAWTTVNHVERPSKKPSLSEEENSRLIEFHKRGEEVRRQLPSPRGPKTQWKAVRDREELTGEKSSRANGATVPVTTANTASPVAQSSSHDAPKMSNGDHSKTEPNKSKHTSSSAPTMKSPTTNNGDMHPLTEAELSHRGLARRVELFLLGELSKSETARGSREADLEKTIKDLKARVASLEVSEVKQAETLRLQREEYTGVVHGMDEKILVLDQEKKDIELDRLDLVDKLAEAEERAKIAEDKIAGWDHELQQTAMNTTQVVKGREEYMAKIQALELTASQRVEEKKETGQMIKSMISSIGRLRENLITLQAEFDDWINEEKVVRAHHMKMAEIRRELDGDLSDFTGKMIKGLEDCFKEQLEGVQKSFVDFEEKFNKIDQIYWTLWEEVVPLEEFCLQIQKGASQSSKPSQNMSEGNPK